jgi:magnesium transporter
MSQVIRAEADDSAFDEIAALVDAGDRVRIGRKLDSLNASDTARMLLLLDNDQQKRLLELLKPEDAASIVEELPDEQAADVVERLDVDTAAHILEELDLDQSADIINELHDDDAKGILERMDPEDAAEVQELASYESDTAGGLMSADTFAFTKDETVGAVLRRLTGDEEDYERYQSQHPYIVDARGRLVGVVSLRGLLTSKRSATLSDIMSKASSVLPAAMLSELEDIFDDSDFLGVPVTDSSRKLIGVVSRQTVAEATLERSELDALKVSGVVGDELRSMPTWLRAKRRLSWLTVNIGLNIVAASIIAFYEDTLAAVIALAVFLPIVSDMSGCTGNQAVAVSMRELALGVARPTDIVRVWFKEISVGLINGTALGILLGAAAWAWKGNPWIGIVVGLALALNTLVAVSIGGLVPLVLKRFNIDPAVASGPMLTTATDMCGFFLVLSLASAMMPLIMGQ